MGPSDALSPSPTGRHTCEPCFRRQAHTFSLSVPASGLLSRVGRGDAFNPQMRFNRFVFLNRPVLSLETHLGVTTSPQAPVTCGLRHLVSVRQVTAASAHSLS